MKWIVSGKNYQFVVNSTRDAIVALLEMNEDGIAKAYESKTSPKNAFFLEACNFWEKDIMIYSDTPYFRGHAVASVEEKSITVTDGNPAENLLDEVLKALKKF